MKKETRKTSLLLIALYLGCALRILSYFLSDNNGGDAIARASGVLTWMHHPTLVPSIPTWGPVYFYLVGPLGYLLHDAELATRLASLLAGTGVILVVYRLAWLLGDELSAGLSAMTIAFSGMAIGYSTTSSSDMLALFFLLAGIWGWLEYQSSGRFGRLILGALSLAISSGIRYEVWIFLPLLCLLLIGPPRKLLRSDFWRSKQLLPLLVFSAVAGSWPVAWTLYSKITRGDFFYFLNINYVFIREQLAEQMAEGRPPVSRLYQLALPPGVLLLSLSPVPLFGAVSAMLGLWRRPLARQFLLLSLAFAGIQTVHILRGGAMPFARYMLTQVLLFGVLSGPGLRQLAEQRWPARSRWLLPLTLASALITSGGVLALGELDTPISERIGSVSPRLRYPHAMGDVARVLRPLLKPQDAVILDNYNGDANILAHSLGLPLLPPERDFVVRKQQLPFVRSFLESSRPRFIVYAPQGMLKQALEMPEGCATAKLPGGIELRCIYENSIYRVYQLHYP